jgi:transposase
MSTARKPYPTDVTDDEWAFVAPYLTLVREDAPQRVPDLREVLNALRRLVEAGCPWRLLPHDFPPGEAVYRQARRWLAARVFEPMADDLRMILRVAGGRTPNPSAAILDSRTVRSTPESGSRAGYDGHKRTNGSKVHAAVDTLGHPLALRVTPADADDRDQVFALAAEVQEATGQAVRVAFVDQGYTGDQPAADAADHGIALTVVQRPDGATGFVLLPRRWVVERSFAWAARFRRLARDYERMAAVLAAGPGLRADGRGAGRVALGRVRRPHAPPPRPPTRAEFITGSRGSSG